MAIINSGCAFALGRSLGSQQALPSLEISSFGWLLVPSPVPSPNVLLSLPASVLRYLLGPRGEQGAVSGQGMSGTGSETKVEGDGWEEALAEGSKEVSVCYY